MPTARRQRRTAAWAATAVLALVGLTGCGGTAQVSVFPIPGSRLAPPQSQIVFRGLPVSQLGRVNVRGSRSGVHTGRIAADSDGKGGSFLPARPFTPGETVTVRTSVPVRATEKRSFSFQVATPAPFQRVLPMTPPARTPGDTDQFRSRPDLHPASTELLGTTSAASGGDIFLAPQNGPVQTGPMILDSRGNLVWFDPMPSGQQATDFRVQYYQNRPMLTWWQGGFTAVGVGTGHDVIMDSSLRPVANVRAGNGLSADLHEFQLTSQDTALITAYQPVYWDSSSVGGSRRSIVLDAVAQEIDVRTGLVLFQWDSLDHVPLSDSDVPVPTSAKQPYDYFHINAVKPLGDGTLLVSGRNTWAAYRVSRSSGQVLWRLGGKHSSFRVASQNQFAFQHDVEWHGDGGATITLFDDGAGPPSVHRQSRALGFRLTNAKGTATLVRQYTHTPSLLANFEGNLQVLPDGDAFVGWGQQPYFSEFSPSGKVVFDGRFTAAITSYRAYRMPWSATPSAPPQVSASVSQKSVTIYASWNGATSVAAWRVLAGTSQSTIRPQVTVPQAGFETSASFPVQRYVAVQALDSRGHVLRSSATIRVPGAK